MTVVVALSIAGWLIILIMLPRIVLGAIDQTRRNIAIQLIKQGYRPTQIQTMIGLSRKQLIRALGSDF